jgi:hypothetical protein
MGGSTGAKSTSASRGGSGGAAYGLGLIGSFVYFWQQADTFWQHIGGILKAIVWPAFLVYDAFSAFHR